MAAVRHLGFSKLDFLPSTGYKRPKCVIPPNFVKIDGTTTELWQFNDFSKKMAGGQPPYSIFIDWNYITGITVQKVNVCHCAKFRVDRSNRS